MILGGRGNFPAGVVIFPSAMGREARALPGAVCWTYMAQRDGAGFSARAAGLLRCPAGTSALSNHRDCLTANQWREGRSAPGRGRKPPGAVGSSPTARGPAALPILDHRHDRDPFWEGRKEYIP